MEQPAGGGRGGRRTRSKTRPWRSVLTGVVFGAIIGLPVASIAAVRTQNFVRGDVTVEGPRVEAYDYQNGSTQTWSGSAEFDFGTLTDTITDLTDSAGDPLDHLTLEPVGPAGTVAPDLTAMPWPDLDWRTRQCHTLDHTDPNASTTADYVHRVEIDLAALMTDGLIQSDLGDLRVIDGTGGPLTFWADEADGAVWVKLPSLPAGTTTEFCLYYGAQTTQAPIAGNTEAAVFSTSTATPVYYAVHTRYGTGTSIDVASYIDGNQVSVDGGTPVTIDDGELVTIDDIVPGSVISSTGPITARARGNGFDSLVPISWAATEFVVPSERDRQRLSFFAPFADAEVTVYDSDETTPLAVVTVPVGTAVWVEPDTDPVDGNDAILVESDEPILMVHDQSGATQSNRDGRDTYPVAPFLDEEWFGVSSSTRLAADTTVTHIDQYQSNNAVETDRALDRGERINAGSAGGDGGGPQSGTYLRLDTDTVGDPPASPDAAFAAISQADGDGSESVTFFPRSELNSRYLVPTTAEYIAISCPEPNVDIEIRVPGETVVDVTCTGLSDALVGHALHTASMEVTLPTATAAGEAIEVIAPGGEPFYMHYENEASNDETNVMGPKQFRPGTVVPPTDTVIVEGLFPDSGTWLSPTVQTPLATGVFGTIDFDGVVVTGDTNIKVQIATGSALPPTTFLGPDGTAATFYEIADLPSAIDFSHDGDEFIRLLVTLETSDPTDTPELASIEFDYDLPLLVRAIGTPNAIAAPTVVAPDTETVYLVRLTSTSLGANGSAVRLLDIGATGTFAARNLGLENVALGIDSTQSLGGVNGNDVPQTFGSAAPLSVLGTFALTGPAPAVGSVDVLIHVDVESSGIWAETDIVADLSTP